MKCMFLSASRYSISNSIVKGFNANDWEIKVVDFLDFFNKKTNRFMAKTSGVPDKIRKHWANPYQGFINKKYLEIFEEYQPDLIFIYNNQLVEPGTIQAFKNKSKIAFILGDNPFYIKTKPFNAYILFFADYIICPDTFWIYQLSRIGLKNLYFDALGFDSEVFHSVQLTDNQLEKYASDVVYVGASHIGTNAYKRFLFLNGFNSFRCKFFITGRGYKTWKRCFPKLEKNIIGHNLYDPGFNNIVYNCSKIAAVDLPPSLFNGIHVRLFDALGAGILPLCEHSNDLDIIFKGIDYPSIKVYDEIPDITRFYLDNDQIRSEVVEKMRNRILETYSFEKVINRLIKEVFSS